MMIFRGRYIDCKGESVDDWEVARSRKGLIALGLRPICEVMIKGLLDCMRKGYIFRGWKEGKQVYKLRCVTVISCKMAYRIEVRQ
jgi:hypothetical protein